MSLEERVKQQEHDKQVTQQVAARIVQAWDDLVVPPEPTYIVNNGLGEAEVAEYVELLKNTIRDLARQANAQEGIAQTLAEANVRQTKLVTQLRMEINRLKLERMNQELAVCPDLHGGQDAA